MFHVSLPSLGREFNLGSRVIEQLMADLQTAGTVTELATSSKKLLNAGVIVPVGTASSREDYSDWDRYGWGPAIEAFLASRTSEFVDEGDLHLHSHLPNLLAIVFLW